MPLLPSRCRHSFAVLLLGILPAFAAPAAELAQTPTKAVTMRGILSVAWGDPAPGSPGLPVEKFLLVDDGGVATELLLRPEMVRAVGGARRLNGRRIEVTLESPEVLPGLRFRGPQATILSLRVLSEAPDASVAKALSGSQPWVSILCKFADVSTEPKTLSYFEEMYSSNYPGLDHYWREVSFDNVNVIGSTAVHWVNLPQPVSHYETPGGGDLNAMFNDCTAAADSMVFFPDFVGINMMFNDEFGPYAWGGGRFATLDGQSKLYRVTWEPPWGYSNITVMSHEMGHGFGLPHSNNADGDSSPYDNPWDVMSDAWGRALHDATYGTVGKHTIGYHKDMLGWISSSEELVVDSTGIYDVVIDHLAMGSTSNLRLVTIEIPGSSRSYTVEVRDRVGYDGNLAGYAVILHEIDPSRGEPAWLIDPIDPSNGADEGAMWRVGECFEDLPNEISVCVEAVTTHGFEVRISFGDTGPIFDDGFESGNADAWSASES